MIRVSVMYPKGDGKTFDIDYYKNQHMAIVHENMGASRTEVDNCVDGPYMAIGHLYYDSMEALQAGMAGAAPALADIPNFTNAEPVMVTSEILD